MASLTAERLRELLHYDPETGAFIWRVSRGCVAVGTAAGNIRVDGYRLIGVDGTKHMAGRLAWLYVTGEWPAGEVDHKNCIHDDNRFTNLREATSEQNKRNTRRRRDNSSGFKGASFRKRGGRWRASIAHTGKQRHLGTFDTAAEAHAAYCAAAIEIDPEFSRFA